MGKRLDNAQEIRLDELRAHPEMLVELLDGERDISVVLSRMGDTVKLRTLKGYSRESRDTLAAARSEHAKLKSQGYGRREAIADFERYQRALSSSE